MFLRSHRVATNQVLQLLHFHRLLQHPSAERSHLAIGEQLWVYWFNRKTGLLQSFPTIVSVAVSASLGQEVSITFCFSGTMWDTHPPLTHLQNPPTSSFSAHPTVRCKTTVARRASSCCKLHHALFSFAFIPLFCWIVLWQKENKKQR